MKILKILLLLVACAFTSYGQEMKIIKLKKGTHATMPAHFYIEKVVDKRIDTATIGKMRAGLMNRQTSINLQGGVAKALTEYMGIAPTRNNTNMALIMSIDQLTISEKGGAAREQALIEYSYSFWAKDVKLVSYSGSAYVESSLDASVYIERLVRQSIDNVLEQANNQWAQLEGLLKPAQLEVQVVFEKTGSDPNLIYYSRSRPLAVTDFGGKVDDLSLAAAATFCGLGINLSSQTNGGKMIAKVSISVAADASKSWMRAKAKNAVILSHEQIHFDIAAMEACKLRNRILKQKFSAETMQDELMKLYQEASKQLGQEQDRYDTETAHGQKKSEQATWKSNLESQLAVQDCF